MDREILTKLIAENKSTYSISKELGMSQTNVRYYLKKYGLKTNRSRRNESDTIDRKGNIKCIKCNLHLPVSEFYTRNRDNKLNYRTECKKCHSKSVILTKQTFKVKCLEYLGLKCSICNYSKCVAALEFHHLDSTKKEFNISKKASLTLSEEVKLELNKCIVVCSNCHREIHNTNL